MSKQESAKTSASLIESNSLSALELFQGLSKEALAAIERTSETTIFRAGHTFFRAGERGGEMLFVLEKGAVQTFRIYGTKKLVIAELKPPAIFGEMGCVGQQMYHCSGQTTEESLIRIISKKQLDTLLHEHPSITRKLLDLVSERFVRLLLDLEGEAFRPLIPRLARLLLERAEGELVRDISHQQIAENLRVYRESATTAIGELRKAGIVSVGRKEIRILDRARLERAARE